MLVAHTTLKKTNKMTPLNLSISLITFLLSLVLFSYLPDKTHAIGSYFHNVDVTSLFAASACNRHPSSGSNTRKHSTTLEVAHMHGPCSPLLEHTNNNKPSLADILSHDQSRVDSIQARPKQNLLPKQYKNNKANLPTQSGLTLNTGGYVVTIGLGAPQQNVTLIFDTGSPSTWTQCNPCVGHCYKQREPVYNPLSSRTYSSISCDSSQCSKLGYDKYCYAGPCVYHIQYGDGSYSVGMLSKERLTLTPTTDDVFPDFIFGCGQKNRGLFGETAGLLGLGMDPYNGSFLYQTASKYGQCFSYCLPSTPSSTGHLALGRNKCNNSAKKVKFTPLIPDEYFYRTEIVAIGVGGTQLPMKPSVFRNSGTIIDSGTVITRLPPDAYVTMRDEFKKMIGESYPTAPAFSLLDTCYDITDYATIKLPLVSFTFSGGVEVELDPSGIMVVVNSTLACLAFAGNTDPNYFAIFGSTQQKTFEVVYDVAGGKLGFRPGGCK